MGRHGSPVDFNLQFVLLALVLVHALRLEHGEVFAFNVDHGKVVCATCEYVKWMIQRFQRRVIHLQSIAKDPHPGRRECSARSSISFLATRREALNAELLIDSCSVMLFLFL